MDILGDRVSGGATGLSLGPGRPMLSPWLLRPLETAG